MRISLFPRLSEKQYSSTNDIESYYDAIVLVVLPLVSQFADPTVLQGSTCKKVISIFEIDEAQPLPRVHLFFFKKNDITESSQIKPWSKMISKSFLAYNTRLHCMTKREQGHDSSVKMMKISNLAQFQLQVQLLVSLSGREILQGIGCIISLFYSDSSASSCSTKNPPPR